MNNDLEADFVCVSKEDEFALIALGLVYKLIDREGELFLTKEGKEKMESIKGELT